MTKRNQKNAPRDNLDVEWNKIVMAIGRRGEPTLSAIDEAFDQVDLGKNRYRMRAIVDRAYYLDVPLFDNNCQPLSMALVESACNIAHHELMLRFPQTNLQCPKCAKSAGVPELIGYPSIAATAAAILGYVRFGGCILRFGSSGNAFACKDCRHRWRTEKWVDLSVIQYLHDQFESRVRHPQPAIAPFNEQKSIGVCPACGGNMYESEGGYYCGNIQGIGRGCQFRVEKILLGQNISQSEINNLLREGKTSYMNGFVSQRTKRTFAARLIVRDGKVEFQFESIDARLSKSISKVKAADEPSGHSSARAINIEAWKKVVTDLEKLNRFNATDNQWNKLKRKGYLEVEIPNFLLFTPHLSLPEGYRLRGIQHAGGKELGQFSYVEIVAFPDDCAMKTVDKYVHNQKKVMQDWLKNGCSTELDINLGSDCVSNWLTLVRCDGSEHSFFELVALEIYQSNFCGAGYLTRKVLLEPLRTKQDLLRLHANALSDKKFVDVAIAANSSIDFSPEMIFDELNCRFSYIEFKKNTGFERVTVRIGKSAPHQIVEEERELLVEYDSGLQMD